MVAPAVALPLIGVEVVSYALVRAVTVLLAVALVLVLNRRQGIPARFTLVVSALSVPVAVAGARIVDTLEYWNPSSPAAAIARNGSSIYGGLFAGVAFVWWCSRRWGVSPWTFLDAGGPAMALGEALSRVGCFLAGCCYGVPSNGPFSVRFPAGSLAFQDQVAAGLLDGSLSTSLPVHPVQLYSTAFMFGTLVILLWLLARPHEPGEVFCAFLVSYGALRLGMAPFRAEALQSMKLFSMLFICAGAARLVSTRGRGSTSSLAVLRHEP